MKMADSRDERGRGKCWGIKMVRWERKQEELLRREGARHVSKEAGCGSVAVKFSGVWAPVVCLAGLEGRKRCS